MIVRLVEKQRLICQKEKIWSVHFINRQALFSTSSFLSLLPAREIRSGMAELLKHAFISDENWTKELLVNRSLHNPQLNGYQQSYFEVSK